MAATWRARNLPVPEAYLACLAVGLVMHRIRGRHVPWPPGLRQILGWPLVIMGAHLIGGAVRAAGPVDLERPGRLITNGPFAYSRNPMYAGWALASLGTGVLARSSWLLTAVAFAAAWTHRDVLREERRLAESFGAEFEAYCSAVPRYVGSTARARAATTS